MYLAYHNKCGTLGAGGGGGVWLGLFETIEKDKHSLSKTKKKQCNTNLDQITLGPLTKSCVVRRSGIQFVVRIVCPNRKGRVSV